MRYLLIAIMVMSLGLCAGCTWHRVDVKAEEPIVIKVEARIDIFNHAAEIEDMVSGKRPIELPDEEGGQSFYFPDPFASCAYAGGQVALRKAVAQRNARYKRIQELKRRGIVGENALGYLVIRSRATLAQKRLVKKENADRKIIYIDSARSKGVPILEVQKSFARVLMTRTEPGMWIETEHGWVQK